MMVKNLSQFKKTMKEGKCFQIIEHFIHPEYSGTIRKPNIVQTNGMYTINPEKLDGKETLANYGKGCWMEFGKASDWKFNEDGTIEQMFRGKAIWKIRMMEE